MKKWIVVGLAAALLAGAAVAMAQPWQGPGPGDCYGCGWGRGGCGGFSRMYDPSRAEIVKGQVVSLEQIAPLRGRGNGGGVGLKVNTGTETLFVHLGPQWFVDKQGVKIAAGDTVEIKGVKAVRRGQDVFIAAEVKRGQDDLKLRDENGVPAWAGCRRGGNG